jgi:hypothetical protein
MIRPGIPQRLCAASFLSRAFSSGMRDYEAVERNQCAWTWGIVQHLYKYLARRSGQPAFLNEVSQFNQAGRRNMDELTICGRRCQRTTRRR